MNGPVKQSPLKHGYEKEAPLLNPDDFLGMPKLVPPQPKVGPLARPPRAPANWDSFDARADPAAFPPPAIWADVTHLNKHFACAAQAWITMPSATSPTGMLADKHGWYFELRKKALVARNYDNADKYTWDVQTQTWSKS